MGPHYRIIHGDSYHELDRLEEKLDMVFISPSPPFYDPYGVGSEDNIPDYLQHLEDICMKIRNVLKDTGALWVQMGDYHAVNGSMVCTPEMFIIDMIQEGWILRSKLIWVRTEMMDLKQDENNRFKRDWEYLYFFTKTNDYYFDERYAGSSVILAPYLEPNKETFDSGFPEKLIEVAIKATCPEGGTVLDCFCGGATTGAVALKLGRNFIGIEIDSGKISLINKKLRKL